ncbi:hypothetical protein YC2023_014042 [Brassica napus]
MFGSAPRPLQARSALKPTKTSWIREPTSCNYYQTTPSCNLQQKTLITLKNMLLLDPNYYLESGGGEGEFALMSSSTNSPLPNTTININKRLLNGTFGSSNFQTEATNDVFLNNNNNLANFVTNENTKLYANSSVAGAGAAFAGGTTIASADQSTISWEDINSLVNSDDASYFNGPNHVLQLLLEPKEYSVQLYGYYNGESPNPSNRFESWAVHRQVAVILGG